MKQVKRAVPPPYVETDHYEDFEAMLTRQGRLPYEFDLSGTPGRVVTEHTGQTAVVSGPVVSSVTVRSKRNDVSRTYLVTSVEWVNEVASDIDKGIFG